MARQKTATQWVKSIQRIERHRNGVGGAPFYAVTFTGYAGWAGQTDEEGRSEVSMVAVLFDKADHCAVLSYADPRGGIDVEEAWRGDYYEPELRKAIAEWERGSAEPEPICAGGHVAEYKGRSVKVSIPGCNCKNEPAAVRA